MGSERPTLISLLSFAMIAAGVPSGAAMPFHALELEARQYFSQGRNVRQRLGAHRGGHRNCTQLAGPDVLNRRRQVVEGRSPRPLSRSMSMGEDPR